MFSFFKPTQKFADPYAQYKINPLCYHKIEGDLIPIYFMDKVVIEGQSEEGLLLGIINTTSKHDARVILLRQDGTVDQINTSVYNIKLSTGEFNNCIIAMRLSEKYKTESNKLINQASSLAKKSQSVFNKYK